MPTQIHPSAIVDPSAKIGADVVVGPYAFGLSEEATGDPSAGLWVLVGATILGLLCVPLLGSLLRSHDRAHGSDEGDALVVDTGSAANTKTSGSINLDDLKAWLASYAK